MTKMTKPDISPDDQPVKVISLRDNFYFVKEWYDLANESHFWIQWRLVVLKKMLSRLGVSLQEHLHCVDVGCGNSVLRKQMESISQWLVDGFELDRYALTLSSRTRGQLFLYDIRDRSPAFSGKFDVLTMFDILEHYHDSEAFLQDAKFHLKAGGYCIINVPAIELLRSRYDEVAGHELRYNQKILRKHIEAVGFEILDMQYWGFSLIFPLWVRRFVVSGCEDGGEVIRKGFTPPGKWIHGMLKVIARIETTLFPRVPFGTSIMVIARKR